MDPDLPQNALDVHNAAIERVQDMMEELAADGFLVRENDGQEMDPADAQMSGGMCDTNYTTGLPDCEAGPGGVVDWGAGSVQSGGGTP
jgi:hypothetical protein